jgi:hypothetical protein
MRKKTWLIAGGIALAALVGLALIGNGGALRKQAYAPAIPLDYFSAYDDIEPQLYQVAGPVYAFELGFTRSLVLRTSDGIAMSTCWSATGPMQGGALPASPDRSKATRC